MINPTAFFAGQEQSTPQTPQALQSVRRKSVFQKICRLSLPTLAFGVMLVAACAADNKIAPPPASGVNLQPQSNPAAGTTLPRRTQPRETARSTDAAQTYDQEQSLPAASDTGNGPEALTTLRNAARHVLGPNDRISIQVYGEPDLTAQPRLRPDGTVNLPLLGVVKVGGFTLQEATIRIRDLLGKDFLVNPQVSVDILEYSKRQFTIMGKGVNRPGTYDLSEESIPLLQAIAVAGGFRPGAKEGRVVITRTMGDEREILTVDAGAMARNKKVRPFMVLPNDVITIDESFF